MKVGGDWELKAWLDVGIWYAVCDENAGEHRSSEKERSRPRTRKRGMEQRIVSRMR